jgi:hypothetical protein
MNQTQDSCSERLNFIYNAINDTQRDCLYFYDYKY